VSALFAFSREGLSNEAKKRLLARPVSVLMMSSSAFAETNTPLTSEESASRTLQRRAVDAAIWGMPILTPVPRCRLVTFQFVLRPTNTMVFVRSILKSASEEDVRAGDELVKQIKIYPLSKADSLPPQKFVDMTDILYDGLV